MSNFKLLLVDDEPLNLKLYEKMLKDLSLDTTTATNGKECLEKVNEMTPDLIVLDWNMPVMNGIEALEALKSNDNTKDIPVLMITGVMTSSENLAFAMSLGAIDFIKKPFDRLELNARVKNILLLSDSLKTLKSQNNALENKNLFISSLIESTPHPVIYTSQEGILLMCNKFFADLLGKSKDEIMGKSIYRFFLNDEVGSHIQQDIELIQKKKIAAFEAKVIPGDKLFIVSKNLITDNEENPKGIISVFTDISELKKANDEIIKTKKIELISNTLKLTHVTEMNNNLIHDIQKITPFANKKGQDLIRQTCNKYQLNIAEHIWHDFETRFEDAFDAFYKILLGKFPNLTPNERKLCALIRSGFSSKDIAILTFQNPQSVDVARYRLRKKLNLVNNENLTSFLLQIEE